jgi:hypothetical protein
MMFFGLAYFAHGISGGLAKQPFTYYFKSLGMTADMVAVWLSLAAIPWMIKPVYGLLIDLVPLWGYRRKSYLFLMAGCAAAGYATLAHVVSAEFIIWALFISTLGIAAIGVVVDTLMVEEGMALGVVRRFQGQQWTWLNLAAITAGVIGGWISHSLVPEAAIQTTALIMICGLSAAVLSFCSGIVSMLALLSLFSLAASTCPPRAAGFAFAALMSIYSATAQIAAMLGGYLYEWVFDRQIVPLIYLAALCTLTALAWIPFVATRSDSVSATRPDPSGQETLKGLPA